MLVGRSLTPHIPPLQHQLDVDQEEQQHEHPLRRDGHVADEGGHGQLSLVLFLKKKNLNNIYIYKPHSTLFEEYE